MTLDQLRSAYGAVPFRPFFLLLVDGRRIPVNHPELIMPVPGGDTILVCHKDDTVDIIDLPQVVSLELKPAARGPSGRRKPG